MIQACGRPGVRLGHNRGMTRPPFPPFTPPIAWLEQLLSGLRPPAWLQDELENRLVLLLNHVLQQEPEAMARLKRQTGQAVRLCWGAVSLTLQATSAGLLERCGPDAAPALTITVQDDALSLGRRLMAGERPAVDVQGDVQLAAEVAWLADNVRWDVQEDLSRLLGDAPAHVLMEALRRVLMVLRGLGDQARSAFDRQPAAAPAPAPASRAPDAGAAP